MKQAGNMRHCIIPFGHKPVQYAMEYLKDDELSYYYDVTD